MKSLWNLKLKFKAQTSEDPKEQCQVYFTTPEGETKDVQKLEKRVCCWLWWRFTARTSSVVVCVWSKRSAADLRRLPVSPWPPAGLRLKPAELRGEAANSAGRSAPADWSSSAGSVAPARPSGRSWRDCGCQTPHTGCGDGHRGLGFGCAIGPDLSECEGDVDGRGLNNHLPGALRSAASPAGRTWMRTSIPTRGTDESTARRGSRWASPGCRYSPRPPSRPLWRGKPASSPSPPRKSVSPRGSCRGGGTDVAGPPPGPCCRGSRESRGAACWSPLTWREGPSQQWLGWRFLICSALLLFTVELQMDIFFFYSVKFS